MRNIVPVPASREGRTWCAAGAYAQRFYQSVYDEPAKTSVQVPLGFRGKRGAYLHILLRSLLPTRQCYCAAVSPMSERPSMLLQSIHLHTISTL